MQINRCVFHSFYAHATVWLYTYSNKSRTREKKQHMKIVCILRSSAGRDARIAIDFHKEFVYLLVLIHVFFQISVCCWVFSFGDCVIQWYCLVRLFFA